MVTVFSKDGFNDTLTLSEDHSLINFTIVTAFNNSFKNENLVTNDSLKGSTRNQSVYLLIFLALLMILMTIVGIMGNSIVCLIVYRKSAMRSAINLLLANMALCDILLSAICMPFSLVTVLVGDWIFNEVFCQIDAFFHSVFVIESVCTLMIISVDRYLIIVQRKDKLTQRTAKMLIFISWCFSLCISSPPLYGWAEFIYYKGYPQCMVCFAYNSSRSYLIVSACAMFFIPFIIMLFSYICILRAVHRNSIKVHHVPVDFNSHLDKLGLDNVTQFPKFNVDMGFKTRTFTTILLLFIIFLICWTPYAITILVNDAENMVGLPWINIVVWLSYMNASCNPIIYGWRIKKFREACWDSVPKSCSWKCFADMAVLKGRMARRVHPSVIYEIQT